MKPSSDTPSAKPRLSPWKALIPVAIGLAVVTWLFHRDFNPAVWHTIHFDSHVIACIALGWMFMLGRDFGLSWRFRTLTDKQLRWWQAIKVNMLCEFTSCVTPSAVGGSSLGMVFLNSEGIELGRATTLMITTLFLDELFFVIALPVVMLLVPYGELFGFGDGTAFDVGLKTVFWLVYSGIVLWTVVLFLGILVRPQWVRGVLQRLFALRWLRRWQGNANTLADNMVATSAELRTRSPRWWLEVFAGTALSWSSRFLVVNALFLAFAPGVDQGVVLARQFVIWVVLMVSPTPGGSGLSEWLFTRYYGDLISSSIALVMALFWRMITYYVYLIIGVCIVPRWVQGVAERLRR